MPRPGHVLVEVLGVHSHHVTSSTPLCISPVLRWMKIPVCAETVSSLSSE